MKLAIVRRNHASTSRAMKTSGLFARGLMAIGLMVMTVAAQARPVIPGAAGFGIETVAGRGGTVYKVTNLNASGSGSLKACIDADRPRVCIFEVSGTIRLSSDLLIRNNRITIAGQTAPSPGITLRGAALRIQASDVLIQHLRVRVGDDTNGPDPANRDALKLEGTSTRKVNNVVIDHCTFSWAIDETVSVWGPYDNITFSNNIFAEPLNDSIHPKGRHGFGVIFDSQGYSSVTMVGNLFAHQVERNPLTRASEFVFLNNMVYNRGTMDVDIQSQSNRVTKNTVIHNVFVRGPSYSRDTTPIYIRTSGDGALGSGSRVYQAGNHDIGYVREIMSLTGGTLSGLLSLSSYPVWNGGMTVQSTANDAVYNRVLAYAGARPRDRDVVDKRIISQVKARTGAIINCVASNGTTRCTKNGGGWPTLAQNRRTLTLPANHASVASNGYTNLENWLHNHDETIAGVLSSSSPLSPASLSVQ
jgi:pectate lyase